MNGFVRIWITFLAIVALAWVGKAGWDYANECAARSREARENKEAQALCKHAAKELLPFVKETESGEGGQDYWSKPYRYQAFVTPAKAEVVLTSAGRDGVFDTEDDIVVVRTDYNKARLAGHYAGQRAKEFLKGFKQGIKEPSRFEEK